MPNTKDGKIYFSINEVSKAIEVESYVIRYWEKEFTQLTPAKNRAGNRIFTKSQVKLISKIKKLLREERLTIDQARKRLNENENKPDEEQTELFEG